jgi:hypothetical protein
MRDRPALALAVSLALSVNATQAAELPAPVAKDLKAVAEMGTEAGGKPLIEKAVKTIDLNGDGKPDYVLDVGSVNCDGAASIYGDREKSVTVYVADGKDGAVVAFSDSVYGVEVEGSGAAAKLWLTVSGAQCGKPPAPDFASENFCTRALVWDAKAKRFDYAPVSTVRMVQ